MSRIASTRLRGSGKILASGGIRTGMDVLKSLVLGADMAGLALPLIRAEREKGTDGVIEYVEKIASVVRTGMVLTGSASVKQLHSVPYWFTADFSRTLESYTAADPEKADGEALR